MITASHNPGEWNGVKFKGSYGGSATVEITNAISKCLYKTKPKLDTKLIKSNIVYHNFVPDYIKQITDIVDPDAVEGLSLVIDSMNGCGGKIIESLLGKRNKIKTIRYEPDPMFGGKQPEPMLSCLKPLVDTVKLTKADLGYATDGDADRSGVVDDKNNFIISAKTVAVLVQYLIEHRKWSGAVVKSLSVSNLVDNVCQHYGVKLYTTPVGFKYIGELMMTNDVLIGGEESGGIGLKNHIPERDGPLVGLMLAEMLSKVKKPFSEILYNIESRFGKFYYDRIDVHYEYKDRLELIPKFIKTPPNAIAQDKVVEIQTFDGVKFFTRSGNWLLIRTSGTEPVVRIYAENLALTHRMMNEIKSLLFAGKKQNGVL